MFTVPFDYTKMIYNNIKLEGLHVLRWKHRWFEGINQIRDWILEVSEITLATISEQKHISTPLTELIFREKLSFVKLLLRALKTCRKLLFVS